MKAGFVLEQTLGHVTYSQNLRKLLPAHGDLEPHWLDVPFRPQKKLYRLPPLSSNWTMRGSLFAKRELSSNGWRELDAIFIHTITIALFAGSLPRGLPIIISLDATPSNIDGLAKGYQHRRHPGFIERIKLQLIRRALATAAGYVAWSNWAKDSLVEEYGVSAERVLVVAPGTDIELFRRQEGRRPGLPRILFVGGDFQRKGGDVLVQAFRRRLSSKAELHLVGNYQGAPEAGVHVHNGLGPNSLELVELFRQSDIFALPTRADCLAVVLGEAMSASLPIVTTGVGAHAEAVRDGETGFVVPPGDVEALADALERLVDDPNLAREMGERGRLLAEDQYDAQKNAFKVVDLMRRLSGAH